MRPEMNGPGAGKARRGRRASSCGPCSRTKSRVGPGFEGGSPESAVLAGRGSGAGKASRNDQPSSAGGTMNPRRLLGVTTISAASSPCPGRWECPAAVPAQRGHFQVRQRTRRVFFLNSEDPVHLFWSKATSSALIRKTLIKRPIESEATTAMEVHLQKGFDMQHQETA